MITALLPYAYIGHPLRDEEVRRSRAAQRLSIDRLQRYSLRRKEVLIIHRADNDYVRAFAQAFNASDVMVNLEHDVVRMSGPWSPSSNAPTVSALIPTWIPAW